jgi:hypothetical protein
MWITGIGTEGRHPMLITNVVPTSWFVLWMRASSCM